MSELNREFRFLFYTLIHPYNGYDGIKWDGRGSSLLAVSILVLSIVQSIITRQGTSFVFNLNNLETLNVPSIILVNIGLFILWFLSNVGITRLMFGEGTAKQIFIGSAYMLLPLIMTNLVLVLLTNLVSLELQPFLTMLQILAYLWSGILLYIFIFQVHQFSFRQTFINIGLTVGGMIVIAFIAVLIFSLIQQIYVFVYTIFNEVMFRI